MAGNSVRVVAIAFLMNLGIAAAKFIGFIFSGSAATLAEAIHSLADSTNQIFLFVGLRRSGKKADKLHQYGYGMEQYVWSFVVAILLFSVGGIFSMYEGIHKIIHPSEKLENTVLMFFILLIAVVLEGYSSLVVTKELKKTKGSLTFFQYIRKSKDQVLITILFEDFAALIGLFFALAGLGLYILTGNVLYDSIASITIGVLLIAIAVFLYRESSSLLLGESASSEDQEKIRNAFTDHPTVMAVKELLTMHMSPKQILVNAHVKFKPGLTLEEVEIAIDEIELTVVDAVPEVYKIFIETHQKDQVEDISRTKFVSK